MSPKRALTIVLCAIGVGSVGSAVVIGTSAAGSPSSTPLQPPSAIAPAAPPAAPLHPGPTLHLPTSLRLISQTTGAAKINRSHPIYTDAISKRSTGKLIGTAAFSCSADGLIQVCTGAIALKGGVMLVNETLDVRTATVRGKIVGGSGAYAGAAGTVHGQDKGHGRTTLTILYHLK